ncbi:dehydrogenase [Lithospermum erythrorhizon]|uniref:D-lactate dehydrogenase (cytochrome) n=1 Tax=Lithospermum erythrorhizon TaxID=34254 RepID=A0AAV3P142_LITER
MVATKSWLCRLQSSRRPLYLLLKESYSTRNSCKKSFLLSGSGANGWSRGSQFSSWMSSLLPIALAASASLAYHSQHNFLSFCENSTSIGSKERTDYVVKGSLKKVPQELVNELKLICQDNMTVDHEERIFHGTPQNSFHKAVNIPDVVVFPSCEEEVSEIIKTCNRHRVPIVPYGGATSIEGHTLSPNGGVCINMTLMKHVKALHVDDMDVVVEPGIGWMDLNEYLEPYGLFFPLDPGPGATIGGMCATRCSGSLAVRYGTMRENVAVLPNGEIIKTGSRARKSAAGYDLTRLMIGSEGTLGVITEVTLRLQKMPPSSVVALCNFPTIKDAADVAMETMISGIQVSRVELLDEVQVRAINYVNGKNLPELPTLMFEFVGTEAYSREQAMIVQNIASEHNGSGFVFAEDPEAKKELWRIRKEALWAALAYAPNTEAMITDVCVPLSRLADLISLSKEELDASPLTCVIVAHAGDGNFHAIILFDPNDHDHRKEAERLNHYIVHTALSIEDPFIGGNTKYHLQRELDELKTLVKDIIPSRALEKRHKLLLSSLLCHEKMLRGLQMSKFKLFSGIGDPSSHLKSLGAQRLFGYLHESFQPTYLDEH